MAACFEDLDRRVDDVQDRIASDAQLSLRKEISEIRNQVISMRRYLAPQRDAVTVLQADRLSWLTELDRARLLEIADRAARRVEDLELIRDRASVAAE